MLKFAKSYASETSLFVFSDVFLELFHLSVAILHVLRQLPFQELLLQLELPIIDLHLLQFEHRHFSLLLFDIQFLLGFLLFAPNLSQLPLVPGVNAIQLFLEISYNGVLVFDSRHVLRSELRVLVNELLLLLPELVDLSVEFDILECVLLQLRFEVGFSLLDP